MAAKAMDAADVARLFQRLGEVVVAAGPDLTELDRAIGDGDHGTNMARGFQAVLAKLADGPPPETPGAVCKLVGMTLISTVGGASGPLYGTAFLRMAAAWGDAPAVGMEESAAGLAAAVEGVQARGSATVGDKTMVDALVPAVNALQQAIAADTPAPVAWARAAEAARAGAGATRDIVARKGRASYLGERSLGHEDPGANSSALMIETVAAFLAGVS